MSRLWSKSGNKFSVENALLKSAYRYDSSTGQTTESDLSLPNSIAVLNYPAKLQSASKDHRFFILLEQFNLNTTNIWPRFPRATFKSSQLLLIKMNDSLDRDTTLTLRWMAQCQPTALTTRSRCRLLSRQSGLFWPISTPIVRQSVRFIWQTREEISLPRLRPSLSLLRALNWRPRKPSLEVSLLQVRKPFCTRCLRVIMRLLSKRFVL